MATMLSVDIGTTKLCALALDVESLRPLAVRTAVNAAGVTGLPADHHEQSAVQIRQCVLELLDRLLADEAVCAADVTGLALCGQMHGLLLVGVDLQPVTNLITWRDRRVLSPGQAGCLDDARCRVGDAREKRTGCGLHAGYGGATLHYLVRNGGLPGGVVALTIADYVAACLTGVMATDPTQAASWGLFDLAAGQWDWDGVQRLGVPVAVLPPIRPSVSALGDLQSEIARSLGLPPKVTVYVPVGDNQASVAGAAGLARDTAVVNLGTGGQISVPQSEVIWVEGFETRPMLRGGPILVGASLCGGWSYAYLRRFYQEVVREFAGVELTDAHLYERMNRMAAEAAPATAGLSVDATFHGTRANPSHRGSVSGISASNLTVSNLTRAFVEGMVQELADMFRRVDHAGIRRVVASGNAVRENRAVVDVIASLFGRECYVSPHQEEAAHGAACAAAKQP